MSPPSVSLSLLSNILRVHKFLPFFNICHYGTKSIRPLCAPAIFSKEYISCFL